MCNFFSFAWDGGSNFLYSDWELRKTDLKQNWDSHTFILTHFGIAPEKQQNWSTYEYNPVTKKFAVDTRVKGHDVGVTGKWVQGLDFKKLIPSLIIKDIQNPLAGKSKEVTEEDIQLLQQWIALPKSIGAPFWYSIRDSIWDFIQYSVGDRVGDAIWGAIKDPIGDSVGNFIWYSIRDPVWNFVGDSVWYSIKDSIRDFMGAYTSSFFDISYKYDFSPAVKLWEKGFVASFDGKIWRLHSGKQCEVAYEMEAVND